MEKHISKKFFAGFLALSAGFILASCDPVSAVPKNYNNPIIATTDGEISLDGNNLGTLYDSITSDRNAKVVEQILSEIAEKKFGTYADFLEATKDDTKKVEFINSHLDFFKDDANKEERFTAFKKDIEQRISEYFYNEITSGSYNDELGKFSEKKLYNAHKYELYDVGEVQEAEFKSFFVDKDLNKDDIFDIEHDGANAKLNEKAYNVTDGRGYIKEKVYPDILRNKLVEDYIYENNTSSLGRAYARELSYVKISYDGESKFADTMMEKFASEHIQKAGTPKHIDFSIVENAYKGFRPSANASLINVLNAEEEALAVYAATEVAKPNPVEKFDIADGDENYKYLDTVIIPKGTYYKETKLGKILDEYSKALKAETEGRFPTDENKAALDSFTADGKSKQYGLLQKVISLMKEDYTTDGWFVKNGGVTELPSAIRDRLFNIRVANTLDDPTALANETIEDDTMGAYEYVLDKDGNPTTEKATRLPYLRNIYGKKVILPSKSLSYDKDPLNYIYHDVDGKAFYICEVLSAPSTAKLNKDVTTVYDGVEGEPILKENISRQVAKILGTKDSYIKDAYTTYLNKYEFVFFDTSLYDYFKSEYPDLDQFDE